VNSPYALRISRSIQDLPRAAWNALLIEETVPFLDWDWLAALESSGSASAEAGWFPQHLTLWAGERLAAAAPLYLRTNSWGDYVYDHFWAEAAAALKRPWYPKLVGTVPATPAGGYRFLCAPDLDGGALNRILLDAAEDLCRKYRVGGLHLLFADPDWAAALPGLGYSAWEHTGYLWENPGCRDFEDYLAGFSKNQRKNIRREYRCPGEAGVGIRVIPGEAAEAGQFERMFELFTLTNDKFYPWDARFVNEAFFQYLERHFRRAVVFVEARRRDGAGEPLAMAFFIRKGGRLWGRYWGAYEEVRDLHFAVCYYAPLDWAIREGIRRFDPGPGSPHKIRRGFRGVSLWSYHKFFDPLLERLFQDNIGRVNQYEADALVSLNERLPLKREPGLRGDGGALGPPAGVLGGGAPYC
jgi:predicted N-acyltransferase